MAVVPAVVVVVALEAFALAVRPLVVVVALEHYNSADFHSFEVEPLDRLVARREEAKMRFKLD